MEYSNIKASKQPVVQYEYVPISDQYILKSLQENLERLNKHGFKIIIRTELNEIRAVKGKRSYTIANNISIITY